jgi:hypothetical protein
VGGSRHPDIGRKFRFYARRWPQVGMWEVCGERPEEAGTVLRTPFLTNVTVAAGLI